MQGNTILNQIVSVFNIRGSSYSLILDSCLFLFKLCFLDMSWILLLKGTRNGGGGSHIHMSLYLSQVSEMSCLCVRGIDFESV